MSKYTIELTILDKDNIVKYIPTVRRYFDNSIGEIRKNALEDKPIIICYSTREPEDLVKLSKLIRELEKKGAEMKIIENIRDVLVKEINLETVDNLIDTDKEIEEQTRKIKDLELGEE